MNLIFLNLRTNENLTINLIFLNKVQGQKKGKFAQKEMKGATSSPLSTAVACWKSLLIDFWPGGRATFPISGKEDRISPQILRRCRRRSGWRGRRYCAASSSACPSPWLPCYCSRCQRSRCELMTCGPPAGGESTRSGSSSIEALCSCLWPSGSCALL